jgi:hypothetical protein
VRSLTVPFILVAALAAQDGRADHARLVLGDYRYFRALSIDLVGRPPTRAEITAFEAPDFSLDNWLDARLAEPGYAARMRRIYTDLLRLEIGPSFAFVPNPVELRREDVTGPDGKPVGVYFRRGQRRIDPAIDGEFCFTEDETGQQFPVNAPPTGEPKPVTAALLDERTVVVQPWWLYADYRSTEANDRFGSDWAKRFPGYQPVPGLTGETSVRVCREEAQTVDTGTVYVSGRPPVPKGMPLPYGRLNQPPGDSGFAKANKGRAVSCTTGVGFTNSVECGCGIGLERCMPNPGLNQEVAAFVMPSRTPLGLDLPFEATPQPPSAWTRMWWGEEAQQFMNALFLEDRDVRDLVTSRATMVNGPLAQFYRFIAPATCCGQAQELGYTVPEPLVDPAAIPQALVPEDTATWMPVADRGPHAAGVLTMPVFLTKYGSRRARAHAAYNAFLCKDFVADTVKLTPSSEPDLTKRAGCSSCHQTLEPLAAYFTRVQESDWTWLPASVLPESKCTKANNGACKSYYDPAFGSLRGAYAAPSHVEAGPAGFGAELASAPEFAPCVVQNVASSLLGRPLAPEDDGWKTQLTKVFVDGGYRMRALVRAIVTSPRYRAGNDDAAPAAMGTP